MALGHSALLQPSITIVAVMSRSKNRSDWDKYRPGDESDDRTTNSASRSRDDRRRDATPVRRDSREDSPVRQDSAARDSRYPSSTRDTRDTRDQPSTRDQPLCRHPEHPILEVMYKEVLTDLKEAIETREAHIKNLVEAKNGMEEANKRLDDANKRLDEANKGLIEANKSLLQRLTAAMDQKTASEQQVGRAGRRVVTALISPLPRLFR